MTSPQRNVSVGYMECWTPGCTYVVAVRRNRAGRWYYVCPGCGRLTPDGDHAQGAVIEHATIWGEGGTPPDDTPTWIAEDWTWNRLMRQHTRALEPIGSVAEAETSPRGPAAPSEPAPAREQPAEAAPRADIPPPPDDDPEPAPAAPGGAPPDEDPGTGQPPDEGAPDDEDDDGGVFW